jgi:uncharacterized protein YqjF (DUF2071 family)
VSGRKRAERNDDDLVIGDFNRDILEQVEHRRWRMPQVPWLMTQTWHDLLFAHWPTAAKTIRTRVPSEFDLDLFDGDAWIGIVPFHMTNVAPRGVPSIPWLSEFPELNVRTYVRYGGRPGVYFFSLDAASLPAVLAARTLLNLPYHSAAMTVTRRASHINYDSQRNNKETAAFTATYRPTGSVFEAGDGSLDYFLTERYCLYNIDHNGAPYRMEIHHPPWPLHRAEAEFIRNSMAETNGLALPDVTPLLHFAKRQDMVAWAPERLAA